jgi:hypothetical protein
MCVYALDLNLGFFRLDDTQYVTANPHIQAVTWKNIRFVLLEPYNANYSPMHLLSYMVDHALGGLDPWVFHFSSNVWAALCGIAVYLCAWLLLGHPLQALACGLLFACHPSHVEAVAWISSRKDLVAALFALLSFAAYLAWRRDSGHRWWLYGLSLACFALGVAGKQSVVVLPGVFMAMDVFVERRWTWRMVLDKVAYGLVGVWFALGTLGAQPATGQHPDPFILGWATLQNLWLLCGFGPYVIYRVGPDVSASFVLRWGGLVVLVCLFTFPALLWWFRKASGRVTLLAYWVLLAMIPSQVLSFVHPVADRYLFFPSAPWVMLAVLGVWWVCARLPGRRAALFSGVIFVLCSLLTWQSVAYLSEWRDPRSVWYGASRKSDDVNVSFYLGSHFMDLADAAGRPPAKLSTGARQRLRGFAAAVWAGRPELDLLLKHIDDREPAPKTVSTFREEVREQALHYLEEALENKGTRVLPNLFFRLGKLNMDLGHTDEAKAYFEGAVEEAKRHTAEGVLDELTVRSLHAIGVIMWKKRDYIDALRWFRDAEAAQAAAGRAYIAGLDTQRQRLEKLAAGARAAAQAERPDVGESRAPQKRK